MALTFLNPLFLFGLAAGVLPILIHRLTQRKAISRKFSAVRLILQSQRIVARPQRLKHLILLALRILAILSLVFIMARPVLTRQGLLALGEGGAKIVMLDNSLSMGFREERGVRFDVAKKAAKEIIEALKGQVLMMTTASSQYNASKDVETRWMRPEEALRDLGILPPSFGQGDPATSMNLAYRKLKEIAGDKEILIISDMARGDWETFDLSKLNTVATEAAITFLRIGGTNRDPNFAVKEVRLAEGEAVVSAPCRLEVTVSNLSDTPGSTLVQVFLSGVKADQKSVDVKAREEGKAYFELFLDKPGWVNGEVRLSGDRLSADDVYYFPLKVREKVKVLVVDGDPRTSLRNSESYYLVNALNPGGAEGSPFLIRVTTEGELGGLDLKSFEALFMLNVARPQTSKLSSFLESGKPVFIFLGDRIIPEEYNSIPLLPWRIKDVKGSDGARPQKVSQVNERHSILRLFSGSAGSLPGGSSLKGASFQRYFKIEGTTKNLLALDNKDPLLVEAALGKGRLFLFASTADTDWNDLPLKTAYLPLFQGLLKEAVGLSKDSIPPGVRFGEPFEEKAQPVQVIGPPGGPGIYQFSTPAAEARHGVNPPFEESDLSKMTDQEIQKKFGTKNIKVVEYRGEDAGGLHAGRKELWPFFLAFLLVVLGAEMVLANKI
jgi:hypothetical protein